MADRCACPPHASAQRCAEERYPVPPSRRDADDYEPYTSIYEGGDMVEPCDCACHDDEDEEDYSW